MLSVTIKHQLPHFPLDVTFQVGREIAVLVGPSGSGKTTILNAIAGLMNMDHGTIRLNERFLVRAGKSAVPVQKRRIGYVFQDYALFPHQTIHENITYAMKNKRLTKQLIDELIPSHLLKKYPYEISGGEKQRAALIRALATEPELLLLDEPFTALDKKTKRASIDQLMMIHQSWGIPIILVTHNESEVDMLANKILYLSEGKIVIHGDRV